MLALASARTVGETSINILAITLSAALVVYLFIHGRLPERAALSIFLPATACFASAAVRQIHQSLPRCRVRLSILFVVGLFIFLPLAAIAPNNGARAACIFPVIGCGLMLAAQFTPTAHRRRGPCITSTVLMFVLFASAALTPLLAAGYSYGWTSIYQTQQQRLLNNTGDFFSYAREHSDTLFIYSHASITLQYVWLYDWPENQVGWGGWYYGYAWFNEAMERYGLNGRPTSDDLFSDNVRFVSASEQTCRQLLSYLQESYGASVTLTQVDAVNEEIKVYSITQED